MAESVYRVTEVIGVSGESWEAAARNAVETAAKSVRDLRVAEVLRNDVTIENGSISAYRVRLAISFQYESGDRSTRQRCKAPFLPPAAGYSLHLGDGDDLDTRAAVRLARR